MPLVTDIETVPLASSLAVPYPAADRVPPTNYKSEEAIAKWREADTQRWERERVKECSLNPRLGRILCIGMAYGDAGVRVRYEGVEQYEALILRDFWEAAAIHDGKVVTWNGSWDLRFIMLRSLALGVEPTLPTRILRDWFRRYVYSPHFDCKAALLNWDVRQGGEGLDEWCAFFGIAGKSHCGADVFPMYQRGEHEAIASYCAGDVAATRAIYQRIAPMFGE